MATKKAAEREETAQPPSLRELRHRAGVSLSDLAKKTGIEKSKLWHAENSGATLTEDDSRRVAKALEPAD